MELAKRSASVVVLGQSGHFNRSFRGESVSPDSVWMLDRLGLLDRLKGTYVQMHHMEIVDGGSVVLRADLSEFPYPHPYSDELPQPALLSALADAGREHPGFTLVQPATTVALLRERGVDGPVTGVRARTPDGEITVRAAVTVAADGRFSKVREPSGLPYEKLPLDRDVIWLRLPFPGQWDGQTYRIRIRGGEHGLFIPTRPDSVRVGLNIPKGGLKALRAQGLSALHERLDRLAPELSDAVRDTVRAWSDTSMLDIFTTLVPRWSTPGLILMGDAAHTLTPILGQGVNHAIIDAVTLAPLVDEALAAGGGPERLQRAGEAFQEQREESVRRSRALQLRQERLFALEGRLGGVFRRSLYRVMDRNRTVQQRVLSRAYFQVQQPGPTVARRMVQEPAQRA